MSEYSVQRFRDGFALVWRDAAGTRRRHTLAAADRVGAEAEARQRWRLGDRTSWPVGRLIAAYREDREREGIATVTRQADAWKAMRTFWEDVSPRLIDEEMCRAYADRRGVSAATMRYELGMLAVALRWAKGKKLIQEAPTIWRPAPPARKERHLTREQFRRFLAAVRAPHAQLYMVLAIATCARPMAILQLTWDRVDFDRGIIDLNPRGRIQTAKRRPIVPIADYALAPLKAAYEARQSEFVIERGGKAVASIKKAFAAASERSAVQATPYTLRHTGCVWRAEDGISMPELAQLMGHDDSRTTEKHYARFSPAYLRTAANAGNW
ncbi:tyrosine-type recombinase/integrase [Sphingomonas profundi]|uniref:tyrosine-type recombinase/integrase n=1 Tax=Alterirhizorhabdus profundi TaxID=2681549 RepID=UPI0012E7379C|nr:site-specific integrase [Sphingomonas profundi]